jgi:hypothetical protein
MFSVARPGDLHITGFQSTINPSILRCRLASGDERRAGAGDDEPGDNPVQL